MKAKSNEPITTVKRIFLVLLFLLCAMLAPVASAPESAPGKTSGITQSELPIILLEANGEIVSERKVPVKVRITGGESNIHDLSGQIRIHGASSQAYPKRSFGITLDAPVRWLGMKERAHWVLNAAYIDRSLMRHKLSYDLFRSLSQTNAPRFASESRFVEVKLNGKYQGVFLLMERVDRAMLGLKRHETNTSEHACIYKAVDHAADFSRQGHYGYEQREPDPLTMAYWGPLDRLNRFVSTTKDAEFFNPVRGIAAQLDLENTMDFHLLVLLTSNMDGYDKNLLLARDAPAQDRPAPRFFFVPWDYDATFGRSWSGQAFTPSAWLTNHLFQRLLADPAYRKKFAERWKQLRAREFSLPAIYQMIDENVQSLGAAAKRNQERWPGPDVRRDATEMKQWLERRVDWLDREIPRQPR